MMQRRDFLATLGGATLASALPIPLLAAPRQPFRAQFTALIGRRVRLTCADGHVQTARVTALDEGPCCRGLEQFSVVLEGDDLADGIYELHDPQGRRMMITLFASGPEGRERTRARTYVSRLA